ncbi:MAG: hypothetical protein ABI067_17750 [Leifsonia sp.]
MAERPDPTPWALYDAIQDIKEDIRSYSAASVPVATFSLTVKQIDDKFKDQGRELGDLRATLKEQAAAHQVTRQEFIQRAEDTRKSRAQMWTAIAAGFVPSVATFVFTLISKGH